MGRPPLNGIPVASAASSTPGISRRACPSLRWSAADLSFAWYEAGRAMLPTTRFRGSKPGLTEIAFAKLRMRSPAPLSRTSATATSTVTSVLLSALTPRPPDALRELRWITSARFERRMCTTGARPIRRPTATDTATVQPSTRPSIAVGSMLGSSFAVKWLIAPTAPYASPTPRRAPASVRARGSRQGAAGRSRRGPRRARP